MGKRSQRRPLRYEKDQSGCIWGFISIFDFRHGRSTRKLLSDRRHGRRHAVGAESSRAKLNMLTDFDDKCQDTDDGEESKIAMADAGKRSVKKLMEEEMFSEEDPKKQISSAELEPKQPDSERGGNVRKNRKRTNKTSKKTCDMHIHELNAAENLGSEHSCIHNLEQQFSTNLDLDVIMEELCSKIFQKSINCVEHDQHDELHVQSNQKDSVFEEKLREATKVFINQKFINGKHLNEDGKIQHSKEFMDAVQTLSSNKELFLKLLQDPNSQLGKHIQDLQDAQVEKDENSKSLAGSHLSEQELGNSKPSEELVNHKQHKFFRRKIKPQERNPSKGNKNSQASNRIVILKPGSAGLQNSETSLSSSLQSHHSMGSKGQSERISSQFSFTEIKRKLKHAIGKERHGISPDSILNRFPYERQNSGDTDKGVGGENVGRNSPSRKDFFTERITKPSSGVKRGDKTGKLKDSEIIMEHETSGCPKQRTSNIYIEARKHLSEMLSNGDEYEDFPSNQVPKTLGRILSLPEYNFSPMYSPGRDWEHSFVTAQMRFSAYDKVRMVNENTWRLKRESNASHISPLRQNLETQPSISEDNIDDKLQVPNSNSIISDRLIHDNEVEETFCSIRDEMSSEGDVKIVKTTDTVFQEEGNLLDVFSEPSGSSITRNYQNGDTGEICDEKGYSERLKLDSAEEHEPPSSPLASPPSSLIIGKVEDLESAIDRPERPSPISVLEPLFIDDEISPASTISQSVEPPMQPLQIQFQEQESSPADQGIHFKTCMEDKESMFEYVKAVLQASGLNWNEFIMRLLSSDQLLDPSLFDEVEFFSQHLCYDEKLLFDCINEVLMEVCERYFGCSPWVSFVKPNIRPVPKGKNLIREVWEGIDWHLLPQLPPRTLDHIVRKDMAKTGTWMDRRFDTESIVIEMGEEILEELMEDTILSCVHESLESGFPACSAEMKEDESSIDL